MSDQPRHVTREDDWWVARDDDAGVASQGPTREAAIDNVDESVELLEEPGEVASRHRRPTRFGSS